MVDYSNWHERRLPIASLLLDTQNPRIPPGVKELSQRELIAELVAHDDAYELARDIALNGFDPVESLIGVEENRHIIIVEGNRRLAALKLLANPALAPDSHAARVKKLASEEELPDKARV